MGVCVAAARTVPFRVGPMMLGYVRNYEDLPELKLNGAIHACLLYYLSIKGNAGTLICTNCCWCLLGLLDITTCVPT